MKKTFYCLLAIGFLFAACTLRGASLGASATLGPILTATSSPTSVPRPTMTFLNPPIADDFSDPSLNMCKWEINILGGGDALTQDSLILNNDSEEKFSNVAVYTAYQFLGEFDVQVDFWLDENWYDADIYTEDFQRFVETGMGVFADYPNWIHTSLYSEVYPNLDKGSRASVAYKDTGIYSTPFESDSGTMRVVRTKEAIEFYLLEGANWALIYSFSITGTRLTGPVSIYLFYNTANTNQSIVARYDNFTINSGITDYKSLVWKDNYLKREDFMVGAQIDAYIGYKKWGNFYKTLDPILELYNHGFTWAKAAMTTKLASVNELYTYDFTMQNLKKASEVGMRLNLLYALSDQAADAGHQHLPEEWGALTFEELVGALEEYTYTTTLKIQNEGLHVEVYELGGEIENGIMGFTPFDKIQPPPDVNPWRDDDFYRAQIWPTEAILLKSAIRGVKRADPDAVIALHVNGFLTGYPVDIRLRDFYKTMIDAGVPFDIASLTLEYPSKDSPMWRYSNLCYFQRIQNDIDALSAMGKKVMVGEIAYTWSERGTYGGSGKPLPAYPFTPQGQAAWVHDMLAFMSNNEDVVGFNYFFPLKFGGVNEGDESDYMGLFLTQTTIAPALREFEVNLGK